MDWSRTDAVPSKELRALDAWLLSQTAATVTVDDLHRDLRGIVQERLHVARDKTKTVKTQRTDSIGTVAQPIADRIRKRLALRSVPDSFTSHENLDLRVDLRSTPVRRIRLKPLIGEIEIAIEGVDGSVIFEAVLNSATAEMICRGVLANRNSFQATSDRTDANFANEAMLTWLGEIRREIDMAVSSSSLGTGYEEILRREILDRIGTNALLFQPQLPDEISM